MRGDEAYIPPVIGDGTYRLLIEAVTDYAIYMLDPDGSVVSWNSGAQRLKGYSAGEIVGRHFSAFYTAEDRATGLPSEALKIAVAEGKFEREGWRVRKDGSRFWALVLIDPIRDEAGKLIGFVKVTRDLSDRKQMELAARQMADAELSNELLEQEVIKRTQQIASAEAVLRTIYDNSLECLVLMSRQQDGSFVFDEANEAVLKLYGKSRDQVVGHSTAEVAGDEIGAEIDRHLERALVAAGPYRYERHHGDRIVEAVCAVVPEQPGEQTRLVVTAKDVTEGRRLEDQLRQSQKMEAIGQLTGGMAHDFNNLLTGIAGSLELLQMRISQGRTNDLDRYIDAAQGAARRAAALTHRLLAFARRQTLDPRPINFNPLVTGMAELIRRTVGPEIAVEVVTAENLWNSLVDPSQLDNALLNLCINARDAMPDGGRLTIETANKWIDQRAGQMRDMPAGQYVTLSVSDAGVGMTPAVIARAFDPFFTTKPIGMGTGLGLSTIYGFMRQSGGQIRIHSEVGLGTTVALYLPRHLGADEAGEPEFSTPPAPRAEDGETVLVVDDEPSLRMLVSEVLEDLGYQAIQAIDGLSGLKILEAAARVDLQVTDVGLPGGMNGRQLADAGRVIRAGLKVLFITGYAENAVVRDRHLDHGMHVLTKPFAMDDLAHKIRDIITGAGESMRG